MKRLCMIPLVFCAAVADAGTYYLKSGSTDLSVAASYTMDAAGTQAATSLPGSADEVFVPSGTYAIAGDSASFATLSGVSRVRPEEGAVLEITVAPNDTRTFEAPVNWNADDYSYSNEGNIKCYGKIVKSGDGTLILASCGKTKYSSDCQDYFTGIELKAGTLKLPQYATATMYFGDLAMSNGTTLVTCGNMDSPNSAIFTYVRSLNGDGVITNETGRVDGQTISPYSRNVLVENVFRGRICHPAKFWLRSRLVHYGNTTGIKANITKCENVLAAGRCLGAPDSVDTFRLICPCFVTGQAAGTAAALAATTGVSPRHLDVERLQTALRSADVYIG